MKREEIVIEMAGTDIRRIRTDVREHGCPEPAFENNGKRLKAGSWRTPGHNPSMIEFDVYEQGFACAWPQSLPSGWVKGSET